MTDPGTSMSLTGVIVMAVIVLAALAGWLAAVFYAGREPRASSARPGGEDPGRASQPEAGMHPDGVPAAAPARAPGADGDTGGPLTRPARGG